MVVVWKAMWQKFAEMDWLNSWVRPLWVQLTFSRTQAKFSKNLRSYGMLALRALVHCRQAGSEDAMGMLTGQGLHTNLHSTGEILAEGWLKKGDQVLMGIVRDCFCWVRFGFLQTLYRVKPKPNLNEVWRRPNLTPQKQSLSVSKWWVNIALGQTRPPAGLGDFQTYLWLD